MNSKRPIFRMPTVFGPSPGPRQSCVSGMLYDQTQSPLKTCAYAIVEADEASLADLLPSGFSLLGPPRIAFEYSALREIQWLAGRGYDMLTVRIPARWTHRGKDLEGTFQPVCWENRADPIISGREELGWSKVFAAMEMHRGDSNACKSYANWEGFQFFEMIHIDLEASPAGPPASGNVFHHKYVPATESWGDSDVDYITMTPIGGSKATLLSHQTGQSRVKINRATWEQMPTQHHIVNRLANIHLGDVLASGVFTSRGGKDLSDQVRFR